jgi:hypothetical protein
MRSGQKDLDEIQRIRAAMEGGNPVITEAQQELIKKHAALLGEDGDAIIQDIQGEAEKAGKLPADVFKLIESCCRVLGKRAAIQELSNEMIREREPERLVQMEAIREQVTRFNGARASGDNAALAKIKPTLQDLVGKYMADVNKDEEDGLTPDTARTGKDQMYQIVNEALLFFDGFTEDGSAPAASSAPKPADCLAPLRLAIRLATYTTEAVAKEIQDPDEATLRCYAKQLGNSKKEIMALSRSLMVGQAASVATEGTRLADEAGEAIKSSREVIRAALRGLGVASDISEASGPTRAQQPPPDKACAGRPERGLDDGIPADWFGMAARLHAGHYRMAPFGFRAEAQDRRGRRRVVNPHARSDGCPSK